MLLDLGPDTLPITTQTALLSLNRTSLYYRPVGPGPEEVALKHRIDELYTQRPYYESRLDPKAMRAQWHTHSSSFPPNAAENGSMNSLLNLQK